MSLRLRQEVQALPRAVHGLGGGAATRPPVLLGRHTPFRASRRAALALLASAAFPASARPRPEVLGHPAGDYRRAADLFAQGERDEATYLFYRGQLRFRIHLAARPGLPRDGDPALLAGLSESVGRPINEWAYGDVPALARAIDRALAWHRDNDDWFTPKARFPHAHETMRRGLLQLRDRSLAERDAIRAARVRNGLPNRN